MRELTVEGMQQVDGGLDWDTGGLAVIGLGLMTPTTALFGLTIGLSMLYVDYKTS